MNLDIVGQVVKCVSRDHDLLISFDSGSELRIATEFELRSTDGLRVRIDPESMHSITHALKSVQGATVIAATIDEVKGSLDLTFANEARIRVEPNIDYEAWTYADLAGTKIVALPGGGVAVWR